MRTLRRGRGGGRAGAPACLCRDWHQLGVPDDVHHRTHPRCLLSLFLVVVVVVAIDVVAVVVVVAVGQDFQRIAITGQVSSISFAAYYFGWNLLAERAFF